VQREKEKEKDMNKKAQRYNEAKLRKVEQFTERP
jgi:hypothetical protein